VKILDKLFLHKIITDAPTLGQESGADGVSKLIIMWKFRFLPILLIIFPISCKLVLCEITTFTWSVSAPKEMTYTGLKRLNFTFVMQTKNSTILIIILHIWDTLKPTAQFLFW